MSEISHLFGLNTLYILVMKENKYCEAPLHPPPSNPNMFKGCLEFSSPFCKLNYFRKGWFYFTLLNLLLLRTLCIYYIQ